MLRILRLFLRFITFLKYLI